MDAHHIKQDSKLDEIRNTVNRFWPSNNHNTSKQNTTRDVTALEEQMSKLSIATQDIRKRLAVIRSLQNREQGTRRDEDALEQATHSGVDLKFCLFIDGLDEHDGDHVELCGKLQRMVQPRRLKICASSRPWNAFNDSWGQLDNTMLRIHDLTHEDIRAISISQLSSHPRWNNLKGQPKSGNLIINEITERSSGVFLWVSIVTKLLREGLTNDDSIPDLLQRLEQFPVDLKDFFKHILDSVEPFYHQKMAGALRIAITASQPLKYPFYSFHDDEYDDEDHSLKKRVKTKPYKEWTLRKMRNKVVRRLNGYCRGLLEVKNEQVNLLHRTVSDFLRTPEMLEYLENKSRPGFRPDKSILSATLAVIKELYPTIIDQDGPNAITDLVKTGLESAQSLDLSYLHDIRVYFSLLEDLEKTLAFLNARSREFTRSNPTHTQGQAASAYFRSWVLKYCLLRYLPSRLEEDPMYLRLDNNEDPNETYDNGGETPWTRLCSTIDNDKDLHKPFDTKVFMLFLKHGANPNSRILDNDSGYFEIAWARFFAASPTFSGDRAEQDQYLAARSLFFEGDIDLGMPVKGVLNSDGSVLEGVMALSFLLHFLSHLSKRSVPSGAVEEAETGLGSYVDKRLVASACLKLLIKANGEDWPMGQVWEAVEQALGTAQRKWMETRYADAVGSPPDQGRRYSRKKRTIDAIGGPSAKRAKSRA
ncbi:hypothetical protein PG996_007232 [Apiospora saccharicola]|uniref:DUF7791 domain-containing protein n=1 Tax=Apiospora saccharicola TaxID=335842 RepID=A0ABR1VD03_9PEZI